MQKFSLVAMGGTFDFIHKGHITLLSEAFSISAKVIIGLTSDDMAMKKGKKLENDYSKRLEILIKTIEKNFPKREFEISKLDNDFGPAVLEKEVQGLVVSDETSNQGKILNQIRKEKNLPPVQVITVPMVLAKDGTKISTTRIKNREIDIDGNLSPVD
ncbi:MAG: pantetheine-phosphate adenylyltransferase [Nitrosopumilus sp.]|nr:pantetheine-phosphate adenylyltransferase [Nitrosopumilus sp.]MDH3385343.1 pantetheine-phosphate adenylyltransferase [Nitrosopumilus sp.]